METNLFIDVSNKADEDEKAWTLVTYWRPRKQNEVQSPPLQHRKR